MPIKTKGWTEDSRRKAAERCRKNKPSAHATGPKTAAGKAISSANSLKHGLDSAEIITIRRFLAAQKAFLELLSR